MGKINKKDEVPTVDKIKDIFININNQLQSLHEYSNKDFNGLNDSFKTNYASSGQIFNNSKQLFKLLSEDDNFKVLDDFKTFKDNIISFYDKFKTILIKTLEDFDSIENSGNLLKIHLNNVNQNLLTFNFLISNYNIFHTSDSNSSSNVYTLIQKVKFHIDKLLNNTDQLINRINLFQPKCEELTEYISIAQKGLVKELEDSYKTISDKKIEAKNKIPDIENKGELSQNINDIITNLQYHDILRQKMEHIQKIHNHVISKLNSLKESIGDGNDSEKIVECLLFVKEIAELQSAQLLHVNKKYQVAIKIISENIYKIGENSNSVNQIDQDILGYSSQNNSNFLFNISTIIDSLHKKFIEILYSFIEINSYIKHFKTIQSEYIYEFDQINTFYIDFKTTANTFMELLENNENNNSSINKQFNAVSRDIISSKNDINNNLKIISDLLYDSITNNSSTELIDDAQKRFVGFADVFIQKFKLHSRDANQKLIDNKNLSRSIDVNIQHSLNQVKYYEYFEKIIEEITNELDKLNQTISIATKNELTDKEEKLNKIKDNYTTQSEFTIHELYIDKGADATKTFKEEENLDDDNIEFF